MGQYYHPLILGKNRKSIKGYWYSHKINEGLKLMEHSYLNNSLCNCVENYLIKNGGGRVVWAGDYADPEKVRLPKDQLQEIWQKLVAEGKTTCSFRTFLKSSNPALYREKSNEDRNLYDLCDEERDEKTNKLIRRGRPELDYDTKNNNMRYLVNDDRKEYVDTWDVPAIGGLRVNPLPLLTCEGNGCGGGDYSGTSMDMIGLWARDFLRLVPNNWTTLDSLKKNGYKEIKPDFVEAYTVRSTLGLVREQLVKLLSDSEYSNDTLFITDAYRDIELIEEALPCKSSIKNLSDLVNKAKKRVKEAEAAVKQS